ncbi:toxin-antitoxin system antitoxin subunit [uncultured Megasphaera sp.]|uniref:toxin-antitoxin system antitoxin subunit n=1 Tax=uncultured Megasphaera sp. TaxID=165188 RepID=UPI00259B01FA|nr:toxin-antitoxin system antitoxin subunit [uncultured Megasphaera sp.]
MKMNETIRKEAIAIFNRLGLSEEEAIELFYKRTIYAGKMPFDASKGATKGQVKKKRMNERFAEWDAF